MQTIMDIIREFQRPCPCGQAHRTAVRDVRIGPGLVGRVGELLRRNGFPKRLLLVADKNTLAAAAGIEESLAGFEVEYKIYDEIRVARMEHVEELEALLRGREIGVLSVGTGSVNDPCRLAAARQGKMLCIFGTAPSMDGFASYSSPIVKDGFKASYPAKSPEVIIGDTEILAAAPAPLKAAGFGDMMAKYIALVDWQISSLLTDEPYCPRVAGLTRAATDKLLAMAGRVGERDAETAGEIFQALLMTGIGMSFMQNSRPASGSEHVISHLVECVELRDGIIPNFHGEDVGVFTLMMLQYYNALAERERLCAKREQVDWQDVYAFYGEMAEDVRRLNTPTTVTDAVDPADFQRKWPEIRKIIRSVPSYAQVRAAMEKAGCKRTLQDIGKSPALAEACIHYSPYMRRRVTLLRLRDMIVPEAAARLRDVRLFLFDMDGTLYLGDHLFAFSRALLEKIRAADADYMFMTNNSSKSVSAYIEKLARLGIPARPEDFITSAQAAAHYLKAQLPDARFYVCGTQSLKAELAESGLAVAEAPDQADAVLMGYDTELTFQKLDDVCRLLLTREAPYIATHPDSVCPTEYGAVPDCGSVCDMIYNATKKRPLVIGKPQPLMPRLAMAQKGVDAAHTAVVGDRLHTDIQCGLNAGCLSILVLTGETTAESLAASPVKPDLVLSSGRDILNAL